MAKCAYCGGELQPDDKFCQNCGAPVDRPQEQEAVDLSQQYEQAQADFAEHQAQLEAEIAAQQQEVNQSQQSSGQQSYNQQDYGQQGQAHQNTYGGYNTYTRPADQITPGFLKPKTAIILGYLFGFIGILICMFKADRKNEFVHFQLNQLFTYNVIRLVVNGISGFVDLGFAGSVIRFGLFVIWIIGFLGALQGENKEMPLIGKIQMLK